MDAIYRRLQDDGLEVEAPSLQHGAWSFSFQAPGSFTVVVRVAIDWDADDAAESAGTSHGHRRRLHGKTHR